MKQILAMEDGICILSQGWREVLLKFKARGMNNLNKLPKFSQHIAKQGLHDIWTAETKADAVKASDLFN